MTRKSRQQRLQPLSIREWERLRPHLESTGDFLVTLVLTDGSSLVGIVVPENRALRLILPFSSVWDWVRIPRELIAGGAISRAAPLADAKAGRSLPPMAHSVSDAVLDDMIESQDLEAKRRPPHAISIGGTEVREIYPGRSILYADWEGLARRRRFQGNLSVGFSVFGVGISVSWERSIASYVWGRLAKPAWDGQAALLSGKEAVICAHLTVLLRHGAFARLESGGPVDDRDDRALVILRRAGVPETHPHEVWEAGTVAAIPTQGLSLPLLYWERIVPPLRFLGEVVQAKIRTELGTKALYIRVLAAGVEEESGLEGSE